MTNIIIAFGIGMVLGYILACFVIQYTVLGPIDRMMDKHK